MLTLILWALMMCVSIVTGQVTENCEKQYSLWFKPISMPGARSHILGPGLSLNVLVGEQLPPVILLLRYRDRNNNLVLETDVKTNVEAEVVPPLRLGGDNVELDHGQADFSALVIQQPSFNTSFEYILRFSLRLGSATNASETLVLETGPIVFLDATARTEMAGIRFGSYGFLYSTLPRDIPADQPLPYFFIEAFNPLGNPVIIPFSLDVTGTNVSLSPSLYSAIGKVDISGLVVTPEKPEIFETVLTFVAIAESDGATFILHSGPISLVSLPLRNKFMLFSAESYFPLENIGDTAVLNVPVPPVIINLYSSDMKFDSSNTGLVITAVTNQGNLRGAEALVVRGVARFNDLSFVGVAPRSSTITFTAGSQGDLPVQGTALQSGEISIAVTPIKSKHFTFSARSVLQSGRSATLRVDDKGQFEISSVFIQMMDSAYRLDPTSNGVEVEVGTEPIGKFKPVGNVISVVSNGVAAFNSIVFEGGAAGVALTIVFSDPLKIRSPLSVPVLLEHDTMTDRTKRIAAFDACLVATGDLPCNLRLKFADASRSIVYEQDQDVFATVGAALPIIRVKLFDQFGELKFVERDIVPKLVAFTADDPSREEFLRVSGGSLEAVWEGSEYVFTCLLFSSKPGGFVKLYFRLVQNSLAPYAGVPDLNTGLVTVVQDPVTSFGLRFASVGSHLTYSGQSTSAVVNVALPTIAVEVVNSLHELDGGNNELEIAAFSSLSSLQLDRQRVSKGRASFSTLLLTSVADKLVLTFRPVVATGVLKSKTLQSGPISVSTMPVPAASILFARASLNNIVSRNLEAFSFGFLPVTIKTVIDVHDSAHQREFELLEPIELTPSSQQAIIRNADPVTLSGSLAAAHFEVIIEGYRNGLSGVPIYLEFQVTGGNNPLLLAQKLTVGPIEILNIDQDGVQTCTSSLTSPEVVAEFNLDMDTFRATTVEIVSSVAYLMGVESDRIRITSTRQASGVRHATLVKWIGTKAYLKFSEPTSTSTNRKTATDLAAEFVEMRPACQSFGLPIEAVYFRSADRGCDAVLLHQAINESERCTSAGRIPMCSCYADLLMDRYGVICASESEYYDTFFEICRTLGTCVDASITNVCDEILAGKSNRIQVIYGTIVGATCLIGILLIMYKNGVFSKRKRLVLNGSKGGNLRF